MTELLVAALIFALALWWLSWHPDFGLSPMPKKDRVIDEVVAPSHLESVWSLGFKTAAASEYISYLYAHRGFTEASSTRTTSKEGHE